MMTTSPIARGAARSISTAVRRIARPRGFVSPSATRSVHDDGREGSSSSRCSLVIDNTIADNNANPLSEHVRRGTSDVRRSRYGRGADISRQRRRWFVTRTTARTIARSASSAAQAVATPPDEDDTDDGGDIVEKKAGDGLESLSDISAAMRKRIRAMKSRHDEVMALLQDGGDQTALGREVSSLSGVSSLCDVISDIHAERLSLLELLEETHREESVDGDDSKELIEEIEDELSRLDERLRPLSRKMLGFVVPLLDPDDVDDLTTSDAVIDIRAGTGGDEACLFAGEIMAAYETIAKAGGGGEDGKSWDFEVLSVGRTDLGGVKEASLVVSSRGGGGGGGHYSGGYDNFDAMTDGDDNDDTTQQRLFRQLGPYGFFQYESGVHRVQRVPVNDVKMQTSAVSVAVLPSLPESEAASALPPAELKIDTMRASGAGGQHVNTTNSAVRVTHVPTGIVAYMQEERSQHKNKAKGIRLVAARVHQLRKEKAARDRSNARSSLMGGGDRSERIRTYNFAQDRITDHRCKVTVQGVQGWLGGGTMVRKFVPRLYDMEREERVVAMEEEDEEEEKRRNASCGGGGAKGKARRKR